LDLFQVVLALEGGVPLLDPAADDAHERPGNYGTEKAGEDD
jgi:hypothetical protein